MANERGLSIDASCIWRWVQVYSPELDKRCRRHLKQTNRSWRLDETYISQRPGSVPVSADSSTQPVSRDLDHRSGASAELTWHRDLVERFLVSLRRFARLQCLTFISRAYLESFSVMKSRKRSSSPNCVIGSYQQTLLVTHGKGNSTGISAHSSSFSN